MIYFMPEAIHVTHEDYQTALNSEFIRTLNWEDHNPLVKAIRRHYNLDQKTFQVTARNAHYVYLFHRLQNAVYLMGSHIRAPIWEQLDQEYNPLKPGETIEVRQGWRLMGYKSTDPERYEAQKVQWITERMAHLITTDESKVPFITPKDYGRRIPPSVNAKKRTTRKTLTGKKPIKHDESRMLNELMGLD